MLNFSFRLWLEATMKDPAGVSQRWLHALPKDVGGVEPQNDTEIWRFVDAMADPSKNGPLIHLCATKGQGARLPSFPPEERYRKKIGNNLLHIDHPKLKEAHGVITSVMQQTMFGFSPAGDMEGNILVIHPPLAFDMNDKLLLASIIRHELRHAADHAATGGKMGVEEGTQELAKVDIDLYASCIVEARAWSDQLRWLLRMLGSSSAVIKAIENDRSYFSFDPVFRQTARYFLEAFEKGVKTEAAFISGGIGDMPETPKGRGDSSKDSKMQQKMIHQAALLTLHIIERFSFSKNIKTSPEVKVGAHNVNK